MFKLAIIDHDNTYIGELTSFLGKHFPQFKYVLSRSSINDAIILLHKHTADVVLLSANLPKADIAEIIYKSRREIYPVKFIIVDEKQSFDNLHFAMKSGAFDYLTKPVDTASYTECFNKLLKELQQENALHTHSIDDVRPQKDRFFSDLLAGRIKNPVDLSVRLGQAEMDANYINRSCALVNIHINSFSRWLSMCWNGGADAFYKLFRSDFTVSTDKMEIIFTRVFYSNIELLCINNSQTPIEKILSEQIPEFHDTIMKIFGVYAEIQINRFFSSLSEIIKFNLQDTVEPEMKSEEVVENAIKFIRHNYFREITLEDVANYVMLSREYFCAFYKQKTGENFVDTLNRHRIESSQRLLSSTTLTIGQVSSSVGYKSVSYFHKIFKSICGMSPSEYRKQNVSGK